MTLLFNGSNYFAFKLWKLIFNQFAQGIIIHKKVPLRQDTELSEEELVFV